MQYQAGEPADGGWRGEQGGGGAQQSHLPHRTLQCKYCDQSLNTTKPKKAPKPRMRLILHPNMRPILECNHLFLTFTHKTCQKICLAHILSYSIVYCITEEPFSFPFRPEPRAVLWSSRVSGWAAPSPVDSLYQMFQNKDCS